MGRDRILRVGYLTTTMLAPLHWRSSLAESSKRSDYPHLRHYTGWSASCIYVTPRYRSEASVARRCLHAAIPACAGVEWFPRLRRLLRNYGDDNLLRAFVIPSCGPR